MRIIIESAETSLVSRWRARLGLDEYEIRLERVSLFAVCDELCRVGNSLVGIRADHDRREAVIFHTRRLTEEDVVHELLHLRHPEWSEQQVNARTASLIGRQRASGSTLREEVRRGDPVLRREVAGQGQRA
jgi:hypothetical protein